MNYISHHGTKGMKWGVRRYQNKDGSLTPAGKKRYASELDDKKAAYKSAKDARLTARVNKKIAGDRYADSYNRAYNYSARNPISQVTKKSGRAMSNKLWEDAANDAENLKNAKAASKQANKDYKQAKRDYKEAKTNAKYEKYGLDPKNSDHIVNVYNHGYKGAQRIQKRMDSTGMSNLKSSTIELGRQSATTALITVGTIGTAALVAKYSNPTSQVLDASGKVLKNFYN